MKIHCSYAQLLNIKSLIPNPRNPNIHSVKQIKMLAKNMRELGVRHPIIVSRLSGFICAGHGRLLAAKENGWKEFPVEYQDFKDAAEEFAFLVSDNSLAELAELDFSVINEDFVSFGPDFDLELLGFYDFEMNASDQEKEEKTKKSRRCPKCGEKI